MPYDPIKLAYSGSAAQSHDRWPEAASQTFKLGRVLRSSSGNLAASDTADPWTAADVVVGIASEAGHNLTTAGTAEPATSEGTPRNQPSAKIFAKGAWIKDGKCGFYPANGSNVFEASLKAGQTFTQSLVVAGSYYAIKYDATSGFEYVDSTDTIGNNCVAEIIGGLSHDNTKVLIRFKAGQRYFD